MKNDKNPYLVKLVSSTMEISEKEHVVENSWQFQKFISQREDFFLYYQWFFCLIIGKIFWVLIFKFISSLSSFRLINKKTNKQKNKPLDRFPRTELFFFSFLLWTNTLIANNLSQYVFKQSNWNSDRAFALSGISETSVWIVWSSSTTKGTCF